MFHRIVAASVLSGVLLTTAAGGALLTAGHTQAASMPKTAHAAAHAKQLGAGKHARQRHGARLRVVSVSGSTINALEANGKAVTIAVTSGTTYSEGGKKAALTDVRSGVLIVVHGARSGATAQTATGITIILPRIAGVVTNVSGSTLTVTRANGAPAKITVGSSTTYTRAGQSALLDSISAGTAIVASGTTGDSSTFNASHVEIRLPHVHGTVTAVSGATITISGAYGATQTVTTTSGTTYFAPRGVTTNASAITTGVTINAEGTFDTGNTTLTAVRIVVTRGAGHAAATATPATGA